jgi:hypothetical protein
VTGAHQVHAHVLARADQVAPLLLGRLGHAHQRELAGGRQPGQAQGVAGVGLDAIRRAARDQPGRADGHLPIPRPGLAGQGVAGGPGLRDRPPRRLDLLQPGQHLGAAARDLAGEDLPADLVNDGHGRLAGVDVHTNPAHTEHRRRLPRDAVTAAAAPRRPSEARETLCAGRRPQGWTGCRSILSSVLSR